MWIWSDSDSAALSHLAIPDLVPHIENADLQAEQLKCHFSQYKGTFCVGSGIFCLTTSFVFEAMMEKKWLAAFSMPFMSAVTQHQRRDVVMARDGPRTSLVLL